jgi:hypothetical protein
VRNAHGEMAHPPAIDAARGTSNGPRSFGGFVLQWREKIGKTEGF